VDWVLFPWKTYCNFQSIYCQLLYFSIHSLKMLW
jgi:hypothetical protein